MKRPLGRPRRGRSSHWRARLSQREREVVAYVVRGASNREIGQRLAISEKTVEKHLSHIFRKLGFTSRAQLAVHVVTHGSAGVSN